MSITTPWWQHLQLRDEIIDGHGNVTDVQMSLYRAVHQPQRVPYSNVGYFSDITHPTDGLVDLLASVAVRLAGVKNAAAVPVWRGDQGMGGGKSHGLVGLYHMAANPTAFAQTDLGQLVHAQAAERSGTPVPADLDRPRVVVLPCDELDPFHTDKELDNIAETLAERWLWRLLDGEADRLGRYNDMKGSLGTKEGIVSILEAVGAPVLTLIDEILDYIRKASADETRGSLDVGFLTDLLEATTRVHNAAAVVVMIASDVDVVAMNDFGERLRREAEGKMDKYATPTATTRGGDFPSIIRKRLFTQPPDPGVIDEVAAAWETHVAGQWTDDFAKQPWWTAGAWAEEVARCYPFHPDIMRVVGEEWASRVGFQKVRATIRIFAATAWTLTQRGQAGGWVPDLIGIGDLPLSDTNTREAITGSGVIDDQATVANYREIAASDIVATDDTGGAARILDRTRSASLFDTINPRVAERLASALFVYSLAPRPRGAQGATEPELLTAGFVPDAGCDRPLVEAALLTLTDDPINGLATLDEVPGKGGQPRRLYLSTKQTLPMFFRQQRGAVTGSDIAQQLRGMAEDLAVTGPAFDTVRFISSETLDPDLVGDGPRPSGKSLTQKLIELLEHAGIDDAHKSRLYVLDPSAYTLLNGQDLETHQAIRAALGLHKPADATGWWPQPMSVQWASSAVFACVNTQKRKTVRGSAADLIAWQRVAQIQVVTDDEALKADVADKLREVKKVVTRHLRDAYQHVLYLTETSGGGGTPERDLATLRLDKELETALDGGNVWKRLAEADKVFDVGEFDATALLHQLDLHGDWGKPLRDLRDAYYKAPRLPLIGGGTRALQTALHNAVKADKARLVNASGQDSTAASADQINVATTGIRIEKPKAADEVVVPDLTGMTYAEAAQVCAGLGMNLTPQKDGTINGHTPDPGDTLVEGGTITVTYASTGGGADHKGGKAGGGGAGGTTTEQKIQFALMGLTPEGAKKFDAYMLFSTIGQAIDVDGITWLKTGFEATGNPDQIASIKEQAEKLGITVHVSDL